MGIFLSAIFGAKSPKRDATFNLGFDLSPESLWIALPPLAPHHLEVSGQLHFSLNEIIVSVVGQLVDIPQVIQDLILPWRGHLAAA